MAQLYYTHVPLVGANTGKRLCGKSCPVGKRLSLHRNVTIVSMSLYTVSPKLLNP